MEQNCVPAMAMLPFALLCAALARAQHVIHEFKGDADNDRLGATIRAAGDVNGDGTPDLVAGAPAVAIDRGMARVYSGQDGAVLHTFYGSADFDHFGAAVSGAGDANQDGFADVVCATGRDRANEVIVFSGKDGAELVHLYAEDPRDLFGASVDGCGDFDQDGHDDIVVGVPSSLNFLDFAAVYSGKDGKLLFRFSVDVGFGLGEVVRGMGDVDHDGFVDLLVAHENGPGNHVNDVISGRTGAVLFAVPGGGDNQFSADDAGDIDADGVDDVVVGSPGSPAAEWKGIVDVYSGADGALLREWIGDRNEDSLGESVAGAGDVNGDAYADVIAGATQHDDPGYARLYSGRSGQVLYDFDGRPFGWRLGQCVEGVRDVDGDGLADVAVGAPSGSGNRLFVFAGNDLFLEGRPASVSPGSLLTLTSSEGRHGDPIAVFAVAFDGVPVLRLAAIGAFDQGGRFLVAGQVPTFFSNHQISFAAVARGLQGATVASDAETIVFH
ncbi:MAG: hypothetical protein U1E76_18650 [Planctomycetota bacterium]